MAESSGARLPHNFEDLYQQGPPPWDIDGSQPAFARLLRDGTVHGKVLDVGCGTGERVLAGAAAGLDVLGVDIAPTAIGIARAKAHERRLTKARFKTHDGLALESLAEQFDSVLDCGFFHTLTNRERVQYVNGLSAVTHPGSRLFLLAFSDRVPGTGGPRRLRAESIRSAFSLSWHVESIEPDVIETRLPDLTIDAWLACLTRR